MSLYGRYESLWFSGIWAILGCPTWTSLAEFDPSRHTTWEDVWPSSQGVLLSIKWTKTRQSTALRAPIPLPALGSSDICPLVTWRLYAERLRDVPLTPASPLLLTTSPPLGKPITIPILRALLRRAAQLAGLTAYHYTPHSLRRGGASFSFAAGVPLEHIKVHGTWTSEAVNRYLLATPHFNTPVANCFTHLLTS